MVLQPEVEVGFGLILWVKWSGLNLFPLFVVCTAIPSTGGTRFAVTGLLSPGLKTLGDSDFRTGAQLVPQAPFRRGAMWINVKSVNVCISNHPAVQHTSALV